MAVEIQLVSPSSARNYVEELWQLYQKYYDCSYNFFKQRIENHDFHVLFLDQNRVIGFTGIKRNEVILNGQKITLVGLSITVIDQEHRSQGLIQKAVARLTKKEMLTNPLQKTYIWSVVASYKPYLVFAKGVKDFFPTRDTEEHSEYKTIQQTICELHFQEYDLDNHLVYIKGMRITNQSVLSYDENYMNRDKRYYKNRYDSGRSTNGLEVKGILTIAPASFRNLTFWVAKFTKRKLNRAKQMSGKRKIAA